MSFELMGHYIDRGIELMNGIPVEGKIILVICVMILILPLIRLIYVESAKT